MATAGAVIGVERPGLLTRLNSTWHKPALVALAWLTVAHWAEHLAQAFQVWVLHRPRPESRGVLGQAIPALVSSELLHYGYALVMLVGLVMLLPAFRGRSRAVWLVAVGIQVWHHLEHLLLLGQAQFHHNLFGGTVPTSVLQAVFPGSRIEIHLFYNALVTVPMLAAMFLHRYPPRQEAEAGLPALCRCRATTG